MKNTSANEFIGVKNDNEAKPVQQFERTADLTNQHGRIHPQADTRSHNKNNRTNETGHVRQKRVHQQHAIKIKKNIASVTANTIE